MADRSSIIGGNSENEELEESRKYKKSLVFSKILKTEGKESDEFYIQELERLPKYSKGTKEAKGKGFRTLNENFELIEFYIKSHSEKNPVGLPNYVNPKRILTTQYVSENYTSGSVEPYIVTVDIFWIRQFNILLMNGPKNLCEDAYDEITDIAKVKFINVKFKHHFLVWIPYRLNNAKGELFPELSVNLIADGVTQTKQSQGNVPRKISIDKSIEALMTLPAIYGLVNEHKFYSIGGDFKFRNELLKVNLSNNGIHIKINKFLKNKDHGERCTIVFPFIIEMVNVFDYWENLDKPNKFPDENFLEFMEDSFNNQVDACLKNLEKLKKVYKELRKAS